MQEKIMTLNEICEILSIPENTIRTYLNGYRFSKFYTTKRSNSRIKVAYKINNSFVTELADFLNLKGNNKALERLKLFYEKENENA